MQGFEIRGLNTTVWGFGSRQNSRLRLVKTPKGIGGAGIENEYARPVTLAGALFRSTRVNQVQWEITVQTRYDPKIGDMPMSADESVSLWAAWRESIGYGDEIELAVYSVGGGERTQIVRMDGELDMLDFDLLRTARYYTETIAPKSDSAYFSQPDQIDTFTAAQFAAATVDNPGAVRAAPVFEITGPITSPAVGVNGESVQLTGAVIPAGTTWVVDTNPAHVRVYDKGTGANRMRTVYDTRLSPFVWDNDLDPGKADQPITIAGSGTSAATKVVVRVPLRYRLGVA